MDDWHRQYWRECEQKGAVMYNMDCNATFSDWVISQSKFWTRTGIGNPPPPYSSASFGWNAFKKGKKCRHGT